MNLRKGSPGSKFLIKAYLKIIFNFSMSRFAARKRKPFNRGNFGCIKPYLPKVHIMCYNESESSLSVKSPPSLFWQFPQRLNTINFISKTQKHL